jgi:hypothetical protein
MTIEKISAWAGIITAILAIVNFAIRFFNKKDSKKEFILLIRLMIIGCLGAIAGVVIWFLGSPVFGPMFGYGPGAVAASLAGGLAIAVFMTIFIKRTTGRLKGNKTGFVITCAVMAFVYRIIAWYSLNDLYNNGLQGLDESARGMVSNIIGWGIACVIGNAALLTISSFIDIIFRPDTDAFKEKASK